jgi:hypothetical protein
MIKIWIGSLTCYRRIEPLEKVVILGYEEYEFYATGAIEPWNKGIINITEAKTGEIIGSGVDTRQAMGAALLQLGRYTKAEINARIEKRVSQHKSEVAAKKRLRYDSRRVAKVNQDAIP